MSKPHQNITEELLESLGLERKPKTWLESSDSFRMLLDREHDTAIFWFERGNGTDDSFWDVYYASKEKESFLFPTKMCLRCGIKYIHQVENFMKAFLQG